MANVETHSKVIPITKQVTSYQLNLSEKEAAVLLYLVGCICGSYDNSLRRHTSRIYKALSEAGVKHLADDIVHLDHRLDFDDLSTRLVADLDGEE